MDWGGRLSPDGCKVSINISIHLVRNAKIVYETVRFCPRGTPEQSIVAENAGLDHNAHAKHGVEALVLE